jgi:hypothetical protein
LIKSKEDLEQLKRAYSGELDFERSINMSQDEYRSILKRISNYTSSIVLKKIKIHDLLNDKVSATRNFRSLANSFDPQYISDMHFIGYLKNHELTDAGYNFLVQNYL